MYLPGEQTTTTSRPPPRRNVRQARTPSKREVKNAPKPTPRLRALLNLPPPLLISFGAARLAHQAWSRAQSTTPHLTPHRHAKPTRAPTSAATNVGKGSRCGIRPPAHWRVRSPPLRVGNLRARWQPDRIAARGPDQPRREPRRGAARLNHSLDRGYAARRLRELARRGRGMIGHPAGELRDVVGRHSCVKR